MIFPKKVIYNSWQSTLISTNAFYRTRRITARLLLCGQWIQGLENQFRVSCIFIFCSLQWLVSFANSKWCETGASISFAFTIFLFCFASLLNFPFKFSPIRVYFLPFHLHELYLLVDKFASVPKKRGALAWKVCGWVTFHSSVFLSFCSNVFVFLPFSPLSNSSFVFPFGNIFSFSYPTQ